MSSDVQEPRVEERPLEPVPHLSPPLKKSWREQRWERRRRRVWLEEALGWVLVPVIVIGGYLFIDMVLNALGTSPTAIFNGLATISSSF
jgi:hypothetical protein